MNLPAEATIGRAFDNLIHIDDPAVSRYHAIIEKRDDDFWLCDLGGLNGTSINGEMVTPERRLEDGDRISIGGAAVIEFHLGEMEPDAEENQATPAPPPAPPPAPTPVSASPDSFTVNKLVLLGAAAVLIVVILIVLLLAGVLRSESEGAARIISPQTGATIQKPETIRVEVEDTRDIERIIYLLDGIEIASADFPPYDAELVPAEIQPLVRNLDRGNHVLTVTIENKEGEKKPQPDTILLAFDLIPASSDDAEEIKTADYATDSKPLTASSSGFDMASLCRSLSAQISGKSWYTFDAEFVGQIRLRASAHRVNVTDDARPLRREIGSAFGARGLPLPLGFVMAIAQKNQHIVAEQSAGLWRVPRRVAIEQGYIKTDEPPSSLDDPRRSAEVAASYMKELINLFGIDDYMYAIACYGMTLGEAAQVRARIEEADPGGAGRRDFWKMVRSGVIDGDGADRVARFFAAGVVGENPRLFGLGGEPLSSLY
jgi:pSer/pThr/pTyr-binding forkhead associated (FHA) protein